MKIDVRGATVEAIQGDITRENVDAIVNAANESLAPGGGVCGAIHRAGGPAIAEECRALGGCETGDAKITTGGNLPARHVIHAVGPVYHGGSQGEAKLLASCYERSLDVLAENGLTSIAFPAISCGIFGYPLEEAAKIAVNSVRNHLEVGGKITLVRFVLFDDKTLHVFENALSQGSS